MNWKRTACFILIFLSIVSLSFAEEEVSLRTFLEKSSLRTVELSKKESSDLLNQIGKILERAKEIQIRLGRAIQGGEADIKYQEGALWMSKLDEDQGSIDSGAQDLKTLRDKPGQLVAAVRLYKALKDLSFHFNTYNNLSAFSTYVGDVAPELELWVDPVFYKLYLLPLAQAKDVEPKPQPAPPGKEKKPEVKRKKPSSS